LRARKGSAVANGGGAYEEEISFDPAPASNGGGAVSNVGASVAGAGRLPPPDPIPGAGPNGETPYTNIGGGFGGPPGSQPTGGNSGAGGQQGGDGKPGVGKQGEGKQGWGKQRDHMYEVDQSVNLMDPMASTYETPGAEKSRISPAVAAVRNFFNSPVFKRVVMILFVVAALSVAVMQTTRSVMNHRNNNQNPTPRMSFKGMIPPDERTNLILADRTDRVGSMRQIMLQNAVSHKELFDDETTPQYKALHWIATQDPLQLQFEVENIAVIIQRYALVVFFFCMHEQMGRTTGGLNVDIESEWIHSDNWLSGTNYCNWYGVSCVEMEDISRGTGKDVVRFNLTSNNLIGTLPQMELRAFQQMREIDLSNNEIGGTIPMQFFRMFHLRYLILTNNAFTGTISDDISMFEGARDIFLSGNQLHGTIPEGIKRLFNLRGLYLDHNQLTGTLPDLRGMHNLAFLHLQNNQISMRLPFTLSQMSSLFDLRLQNNKIWGTIPPEFDNLSNLETLYLFNNDLDGPIPHVFDSLRRLADLRLQHNKLDRQIPPSISHCTNLKHLILEGNELDGRIPTVLGQLTRLQSLRLSNNSFTGSIPSEIGGMKELRDLWLNRNNLNQNLPTEIAQCSNLENLYLEHNQLDGNVPVNYGQLESLVNLRLFTNEFTGAVPDEICDLTKENQNLHYIAADCRAPAKILCSCCNTCH